MAFTLQPGMSAQQLYDNLSNGMFDWWSDSNRSAVMDYLNTETANKHEIDMWRLNNEYNTPENQIKRMIDAGLNPAVAYDKVSTGTSGSAPGTHKADFTNYHETKDRLDRINTLMSSISNIMSSIGSAVGTAGGIQDIALRHQNNWYDKMRSDFANELLSIGNGQMMTVYPSPQGSSTYELYPGAYVDQRLPMLFPELVKGFKTDSYQYELKSLLNDRQQGIYNKQMEVNNRIQSIFKELDSDSPNIRGIMKNFLEILTIQFLKRY